VIGQLRVLMEGHRIIGQSRPETFTYDDTDHRRSKGYPWRRLLTADDRVSSHLQTPDVPAEFTNNHIHNSSFTHLRDIAKHQNDDNLLFSGTRILADADERYILMAESDWPTSAASPRAGIRCRTPNTALQGPGS
jgi:hypothetical protein